MPRLSPALGVIITAALCIGLAAFRYPQVNQQIWEMAQAGREHSANGEPGLLQFGLAVPQNATIAQAEGEAQIGQGLPANDDACVSDKETVESLTFAPSPIAGYVGMNQGDPDNQDASSSEVESVPTQQETVQVTLAIPPQMAILSPTGTSAGADDREEKTPKTTRVGSQSESSRRHPQDSAHEAQLASSSEEAIPLDLPLSGSKLENELGTTSSATGTPALDVPSTRPFDGATSRCQTDIVDPPLVPIVRDHSVAEPTGSVGDTGGFQVVAPHDAVARLAPSPQVTLPSDLPLVNIYRNRWFAAEKPQRLPPVEDESQGSTNPEDEQGVWDWTPSIPLYPSTGR